MKKKIYIAGWDVFKVNNKNIFDNIRKMCDEHDCVALIPLDNVCDGSREIYEANRNMIKDCDVVIANLNAFRGKEPDSGTIWEVGYGFGIGKTVIGYTDITNWGEHIGIDKIEDDLPLCKEGYIVEDFGLRQNLMIEYSTKYITKTFREALELSKC